MGRIAHARGKISHGSSLTMRALPEISVSPRVARSESVRRMNLKRSAPWSESWRNCPISETTDNQPSVDGVRVTKHATSLLEKLKLSDAPRVIDHFYLILRELKTSFSFKKCSRRTHFWLLTVARP